MRQVKYVLTERMRGLRAKIDEILTRNDALLVDLEAAGADSVKADGLRTSLRQNLEEIKGLKDRLSIEEQQAQERGWAEATETEPEKPAGETRQDDARAKFARETTPREKRFSSLGDFFGAVIRAGIGAGIDQRLQYGEVEMRAPSGSSTLLPSEGGFLMQAEDAGFLTRKAFDTGLLASRCRRVRLGPASSGIKLKLIDETSRVAGSRHGGVRFYRANEAETVTSSKLKFRDFKLDLEKLFAIYYVTDELLRDSVALEGIITDQFVAELAYQLDADIMEGTGVGQPLGISKSPSLVSIAKESGQTAATIVYQNIVKMWARQWNPGVSNAVWTTNQDAIPQIFLLNTKSDGSGWPIFLPPGMQVAPGVVAPMHGTLLGQPLVRLEQCESIGAKGDIYNLDLSEYMLIDKEDMQQDSSIHVRFLYDEMTLRFIYRNNGAPLWNKAMTPAKGSNTVSPFVTLDART